MTLPASGTIWFSQIDSEIGWASNAYMDMNWVRNNTKEGVTNLNALHGRAWYQNNTAGNCNNGNCGNCANCANGNCTSNCNCGNIQCRNCFACTSYSANCNNCNAINCANCDSRPWLQPNCNCACTYNCTQNAASFNCNTTGQTSYNCNCNCDCNCCCFVAGSRVLMADRTWRRIETIQAGDMVMGPLGPARVERLHVDIVGPRRLMTFSDGSLLWSEEHAFWTRRGDREWWWSANPERWRREVEIGVIGGLRDNDSLMGGPGVEFAHLDGFVEREVAHVVYANPETPIFLPVTGGSPIIVEGYVVGAGVNEYAFDYTALEWETARTLHFKD